ncbi:MAG: hypothetical protein HUK24_02225 [Sphaerochaetaceae bacterium]|nr:hypothetical protein [Sphaerochaetaceae bacterium]
MVKGLKTSMDNTIITNTCNNLDKLGAIGQNLPLGFIKYTCEKQPKLTFINDEMKKILRFPKATEGEEDFLDLYVNNVFLMIPMEERRNFSSYLNKAYSEETPLAGEQTLLRYDGSKAHVFGWITKVLNKEGEEEFQSVCMDMTESYKKKKKEESARYLKALKDVYDKIFEFDLNNKTVKCLHSEASSSFKNFENIPMQTDDAIENWIINSVVKENQEAVRTFFKDCTQINNLDLDFNSPQITYKAMSNEGVYKNYSGIFIKTEDFLVLFCCRALDSYNEGIKEEKNQRITLGEKKAVNIRTFGFFDVFIGDRAVPFRNKKAKELLALLVDRKGGYVSSEEAISYLWEDESANTITLARYRKVALRLKNTLEEYGIANIVESVDGKRRIETSSVQCDLYSYLSGSDKYKNLFKGSYLTNYSWSETTLGELLGNQVQRD